LTLGLVRNTLRRRSALQETWSVTVAQRCAARYRALNPRAISLHRLVEAHFDEVRGQWEERFERRCGFWRADRGM
jgi:hypothetical protein